MGGHTFNNVNIRGSAGTLDLMNGGFLCSPPPSGSFSSVWVMADAATDCAPAISYHAQVGLGRFGSNTLTGFYEWITTGCGVVKDFFNAPTGGAVYLVSEDPSNNQLRMIANG